MTRLWGVALAVLIGCTGSGEVETPPPTPGQAPPLPTAPIDIGAPVARVGEQGVVGSKEFFLAAARKIREQGGDLTPEQRKALVDELASEEALWQEAARQGLYRDPKIRRAMVSLLMRQQVYSKVRSGDFTDQELRAYFDSHREEFVLPEKVQVKRIFIAVDERRKDADALAIAMDVHGKVKAAPTTFKELAGQFSEDTWKRRGGDLGYVPRAGQPGVDPAVVERAFTLPVGGVSEPFLAGGGYNIVMNAAHRDQVERSFEQMKGTVLRKMKTDRSKELLDAYVASVEARYPVTVDDAALAAVDLSQASRMQLDPLENEQDPGVPDGADEPEHADGAHE